MTQQKSKAIVLSKNQSKLELKKLGTYLELTSTSLVVKSSPSIQIWKSIGQFLKKTEGAIHFWIGDWLNFGENKYKKKEFKKALEELGLEYSDKTLRNDKYVANQIKMSLRKDKLTWNHHNLVAPLLPEKQKFWLDRTEEKEWSVAALRKEIMGSAYLSWLRYTDVWNFENCDERFGLKDFEGKIPGQIVQNILYYYTNEKDYIIDPMAGGGTTLDVCKSMNRDCLALEKNPLPDAIKKGVIKHDSIKNWPTKKKADLIFIDPPYWSQKEDAYQGMAANSYKEYLDEMQKIFVKSYQYLKENGIVVILIAPMAIKEDWKDIMLDFVAEMNLLSFSFIKRIQVPVGIHQAQPAIIEQCKIKKIMIAQIRDLLIFRKNL